MTLWNWILWILACLSSDERAIDREAPRASAAIAMARASMLDEAAPPPGPKPPAPDAKCQECNGTGWIVQPDGHRTKCPCGAAGHLVR